MDKPTKAQWAFNLVGDPQAAKSVFDNCPLDCIRGASFRHDDGDEVSSIYVNDIDLDGRTRMPYPNQIKMLDYITNTDEYKSGKFFLMRGFIINPDKFPDKIWTVNDYLDEKGLQKD